MKRTQTTIGPTIEIDGTVLGQDAVHVRGSIQGRIDIEAPLIVAIGAEVEADVKAATVDVEGAVAGRIQAAERIELTADARVNGDLRAPRIHIADGAHYEGNVEMDD